MTPTFNVLVFPCGSEIGLEIYHALMYSSHVNLFGASSEPSNHGKFLYEQYVEGIPFIDQPGCIDALNAMIDSKKIDFVFPAHDSVVLALAENAQLLHAKTIGSALETCRICRSKSKTYKRFAATVAVPAVYTQGDPSIRYPVFLKPDAGQGSKKTVVARSVDEVAFYCKNDPSLIIMEHLPGREYTIDCFTDRHGVLRFAGARERIRIMNGISVDTKPVSDERFQTMAGAINGNLRLRGAWFFQVKENGSGTIVLMEIAPRIAGSMALYRSLGVSFPLLSLYDAADMDVHIAVNRFGIEMDRALSNRYRTDLRYQHVYLDFDDCLVVHGKVNTTLVGFLHRCVGEGIKIHLLTRHEGDLASELSRHRLAGLFDTIMQIDRQQLKSASITERSAIFIDDSFAERVEVSQKLGIPVFGLESVEFLLNTQGPAA